MIRHLFAALVLLATASPALANGEQDAVLAPVHIFIDAMNKADVNAAAAAFTPDVTMVDEFAPFLWRGPHALAQWAADGEAAGKAAKMSDQSMALGTPLSVAIAGSRAYAIVPAQLDFKEAGRPVRETGRFTFALTKTGAGWRIAAWSWAKQSISK